MKKKIFRSFATLLGLTCTAKLFSVLCRVILARTLSSEGYGLYMLVLPTLGFCLTLAQMGIPSAVFRLSSDPHYQPKRVLKKALSLSLVISLTIAFLLALLAPIIANTLFRQPEATGSLYAIALFIPLASTNNTLRSYYLGQEKIVPPGLSQIIEEVMRIAVMLTCFLCFSHLSLAHQITLAYLAMCAGELASFLLLVIFDHRYVSRSATSIDFYDELMSRDIFAISLPVTASQLLHSLSNFLEPLILTSLLLSLGYSSEWISTQYGIVNGYALGMLMIPTFLTTIIYRLALPKLTKTITTGEMEAAQKTLIMAVLGCLALGLPFTLLFFFAPEFCLQLFYGTTQGASILRYLAIPFLIYYMQTPLACALQALCKNKTQLAICCIECLVSISVLYLAIPYFQAVSVAISLLAGLLANTLLSFILVFYYLFWKKK